MMKNNRCGPYVGRGDPQQRSGSRGDPPVTGGVRGDPPWMLTSRGDPPLLKWKWDYPPEKNENRNSQAIPELIEAVVPEPVEVRIIGGQNRPHGRGMSNNEQPHSRSPKGESISLRGKGFGINATKWQVNLAQWHRPGDMKVNKEQRPERAT